MARKKGYKHSEETKEKQRINNIGKHNHIGKHNPFYGKKHTKEVKERISKLKKGKNIGKDNPNYGNHKLKGHKLTPEQCEKIRQSKIGNKSTLGMRHTIMTKKKMREVKRKHHIYLKENSEEVILISCRTHIKLHLHAYHYIYEKYGKKGIDNYIKWFDEKYGIW